MKTELGKDSTGRQREGLRSTWVFNESQVEVTQTVEIVPGDLSRCLDTCLVRYTLHNKDRMAHDVGLRFLLDTYIGANDGVPFSIPGDAKLCDTKLSFDTPDKVPDYIQAVEKKLADPGTVARLQFHVGDRLQAPDRVTVGGWPNSILGQLKIPRAAGEWTRWEVPLVSMKEVQRVKVPGKTFLADSAVVIYWKDKPLAPGERRDVGFKYGLGSLTSKDGKLALQVSNLLVRNRELTLTALVHHPADGETVTLHLPANKGFELVGNRADQLVPKVPAGSAQPISPVTWRIKAGKAGSFVLVVRSSTGVTQELRIRINRSVPLDVLD
jgi:hypothetical protein